MTRVAIPLFGLYLAPRFDNASHFLISDIHKGNVVQRKITQLTHGSWPLRLKCLQQLGVDIVLCAGFNRRFIPLAEDLGIRVFSGLIGEAQPLLNAFARGEKLPSLPWEKWQTHRHCPREGMNRHPRHNRRRVRNGQLH